MSALSERFAHLAGRFDGLSLRERLMIAVAVLVVLYLAWDNWLWQPQLQQQKGIQAELNQSQQQLQILDLQLEGYINRAGSDVDAGSRTEIETLERQLEALELRIRETAETLVAPDQMARLLEELLLNNNALSLVSLQTLETEALLEPEGEEQEPRSSQQERLFTNIYRHRFAIEFEGDYLSTLNYLKQLEALPWQFFWDGVEFQVQAYPKARVRLRLHTLSLSEGWIGV